MPNGDNEPQVEENSVKSFFKYKKRQYTQANESDSQSSNQQSTELLPETSTDIKPYEIRTYTRRHAIVSEDDTGQQVSMPDDDDLLIETDNQVEFSSNNSNIEKFGNLNTNLNDAFSNDENLQNDVGIGVLNNEELPPANDAYTLVSAVKEIQDNGDLNQPEDEVKPSNLTDDDWAYLRSKYEQQQQFDNDYDYEEPSFSSEYYNEATIGLPW